MTSEDGDIPMARFYDDLQLDAPPSPAAPPPPSKPRSGAKLFSFLLQALVMTIALSLFFLFAGVAAVVLIHLCVGGRALRRRRRRFHTFSQLPSPAIDGTAFTSEDLRGLPCFEYPGGRSASSISDCVVCLECFREGDWCRALPGCNHAFHMICIDRWLVRTPACPICRGGVAAGPQPAGGQPLGWF